VLHKCLLGMILNGVGYKFSINESTKHIKVFLNRNTHKTRLYTNPLDKMLLAGDSQKPDSIFLLGIIHQYSLFHCLKELYRL
jgi:hypothetical protein